MSVVGEEIMFCLSLRLIRAADLSFILSIVSSLTDSRPPSGGVTRGFLNLATKRLRQRIWH